MSHFRSVTEGEFAAFIEDYPRPLERDVMTIVEPPAVTYNDLTLKGPDMVVAYYYDDYLDNDERMYFVKEKP